MARAMGGPVSAGRSYLVGERGPELLRLGSKGGHVTPNNQLGNTSVVVNVDAKGQSQVQGDQGQAAALGRAISAAVKQELVKQKRPGGVLSAA
jgi:phage-related minor tail protein